MRRWLVVGASALVLLAGSLISPIVQTAAAADSADGSDVVTPATCAGPGLNSPSDGTTLTSETINFSWNSVGGCSYNGYTLRVRADTNFDDPNGNHIYDSGIGGTSATVTITGHDNQTLYWGVRAANAVGGSNFSYRSFRISPASHCGGPSLNSPSSGATVSSETINFSWNSVGGCSYNGYTLRVRADTNFDDPNGNHIYDSGIGGTSATVTITGHDNQTLYWGVRAANAPGGSDWSYRTFQISLQPSPPGTPGNVSASGISSSQIQISWSSASGANGYRIKRYDGSSWPVIIDNLGSGTSYSTDSGLSASTTYHYYVCAFNSGGETCNSSYVSGTTQAAPGPVAPVAPTSVAASTTSSTAIRIAWTDASSNEDGFRLRRWDGSSWAIIATLAAGSQAATDSSGLAPGSTYYYHVCSYNAGGESCAATVSATTSAGSTVSTGPTPRSPDTAPPSNGTGGPSTSSTPPPGVSDQPADGETPSPNGAVRLAAGDLPGATGTAPADNPAAAGGQPNVGGSSQPDGTVGGLTWPPMVMLLVLFPLFLLSVWVWLHSRRPGPLPANAGPLAAPLAASMAQTAIAGTLVASRGAPAVAEAGTRFELISELGRGGMGVVWKARDNETGQIVALKLLHPVFSGDPDYVTRFERELDLTQRIHSAHVVPVLGFGVHEGTPYLALAYVDGQSLRQQLADHGPYSWPEARALMAQMAEGLADAHAAGVIHRDLKPSNVLIDSDGVAKLADFGIALGLDLTRVTGTSTLLGTPAYLAPEGPEDERSDLYSLGVIGYELLTGAPPFEGKTYQAVLLAHMRTAPDLEKLPSEAQPIVGSLLEKDPAMRPQSAARLLLLLAGSATVE